MTDRARLPFGPRWSWETPEGGPELQLHQSLSMAAGLAATAADPFEPLPARKQALRLSRSMLDRAALCFAAWASDVIFQEGLSQRGARVEALSQAQDDLALARSELGVISAELEATKGDLIKAGPRHALPRKKAEAG